MTLKEYLFDEYSTPTFSREVNLIMGLFTFILITVFAIKTVPNPTNNIFLLLLNACATIFLVAGAFRSPTRGMGRLHFVISACITAIIVLAIWSLITI